jgi:undecaprenyl-diphosphatase
MTLLLILQAAAMGLIEGVTEFLPVSSTGHLILLGDIIGFQGPPGKLFEIVVQMGAVLAIILLYFRRLWSLLIGLPHNRDAQRFALAVLLAFLPAAAIGVVAHGFIKSVLFNPTVVSLSLIWGGIAILLIERVKPEPRIMTAEAMPLKTALAIGLIQCLAMIPGTSRSGATIMGALMLRVDRRAAAEFSFFLALPTMLGASVYDVYKNHAALTLDDAGVIAVGFVVAFLSAIIVVRALLAWLSRHGFQPFAWYRIALGSIMLILLQWR